MSVNAVNGTALSTANAEQTKKLLNKTNLFQLWNLTQEKQIKP